MSAMEMSRSEFEAVVAEAMDRIPLPFAQALENLVVQVHEAPTREMIESVGLDPARHTLFGLYTGVALSRRGEGYGNVLPDMVLIFRRPLLAACGTRSALLRQIRLTLLHEIGHHLGLDDVQMADWERTFHDLEDPGGTA